MKLGDLISGDSVSRKIFLKGYINFRISQLGRCHRSVQYEVLKVKQDEVPKKTKDMWKEHLEDERRIIKKLSKRYKIKNTGDSQKTYHRKWEDGPKVFFSCTPDGSIKYENEWIPLEIKSLNPFKFGAITGPDKLSREYFVQVQGEILLTGAKKALYVIGDSRGKVDLKKFPVDLDERILPWIEERVLHILRFQDRGWWIYPEYLPGSEKCRWCLFKNKCKEDSVYKGWKFSYDKVKDIKRDDFDFEVMERLSGSLEGAKVQFEDSKKDLLRIAHELKTFCLRKRADKLVSKKFELSLGEINKILEETQV